MTGGASLHAFVRGRVQGVLFRSFVERHARRLGLVGYARNLFDGRVEVVAEGEKAALEELLRQLHLGPPGARVEGVDAEWGVATGRFRGFDIKH
ncbi:MAG: acylphosphatase [Chloroflexi bacterium]|nr:acylphosphatase [Chloroflexota bacterium]